MLLLGISTNCSGEVGWWEVGGWVGSGIYVVKRISSCKACWIVSRKKMLLITTKLIILGLLFLALLRRI